MTVPVRVARRRGGPVSAAEMDAVFQAAARDQTIYGVRDAGIIALFFGTGLRSPDLIALQVEHLHRPSALVSVRRDNLTRTVRLPPVAAAALDRWLDIRGLAPGPLFNPVKRPDRILLKPGSSAMLSDSLFRRCVETGILPFSPDDVSRTRSMWDCGRWYGAWGRNPRGAGGQLVQPEDHPRAAEDPNQMLVVRYLSHFGHARRSALLERLDRVAVLISDGKHKAFTLSWSKLHPDQVAPGSSAFEGLGLRELHLLKNALNGLLREGVAGGFLDQTLYTSVVSDSRASGRPVRPLKQPVEQLLTTCPGQRNPMGATSICPINSGLAGPSRLEPRGRN
jgi:hypothetical protein